MPIYVVGALATLLLGACLVAQRSAATPEHAVARRRRLVQRHPVCVTGRDIRDLLERDGVSATQARFITDKAAEHGIGSYTMWLWLQQFDARALCLVVAADLSLRELLTHMTTGTVPDLDELRVLAAADGLAA